MGQDCQLALGGLDKIRHKGHPGDTRPRHHQQRQARRHPQRQGHVDPHPQERGDRRQGAVHVPGQLCPRSEPGRHWFDVSIFLLPQRNDYLSLILRIFKRGAGKLAERQPGQLAITRMELCFLQ